MIVIWDMVLDYILIIKNLLNPDVSGSNPDFAT
jgi:hypothetical protein